MIEDLWFIDILLMIDWKLFMIDWWLNDEWLLIDWLIDWHKTDWWLQDDWFMIDQWLIYE